MSEEPMQPDSHLTAFCEWFAEKIRDETRPRENFDSYGLAPGICRLYSGLAMIAGGEVARLRTEGYNGDVVWDILHDEHSFNMACNVLDLKPGTPEHDIARKTYDLAVEAALEISIRLHTNR
jgi:hypothetical protein